MPEIYNVSSVLAPKTFLAALDLELEAEIIAPGIQPSRGTGISSAEGQSNHHFILATSFCLVSCVPGVSFSMSRRGVLVNLAA